MYIHQPGLEVVMVNAPRVDFYKLIELAKAGGLDEARRQVGEATKATPAANTNRNACLLYATGLVLFREEKYKEAYICHVHARHMWGTSDETAPIVAVENDLAWFYAMVAAGRRRAAWPVLKNILSSGEAPLADELAALAAFVGGKRVSKLCWRML